MHRFDYQQLRQWAQTALQQVGASSQVAADTAEYLLEGDLLGYRTHGIKRLAYNVSALVNGSATGQGDITVLKERAAVASWDANFLPGLHVAKRAVQQACDMAVNSGVAVVVVRRAQHVASLAAYLRLATERGLVVSLMASTPAQSSVAPFGGKQRVFSPNPFAIGVPTSNDPLLLDMSFSVTAAGKIRQAYERGESLPWPAIITGDGEISHDPADYLDHNGAILPLGGADLGYKGYGLCLMSEIWTMALSNYGRLQGANDGEANSLIVQVMDPAAFGELADFVAVTDDLLERCRQATPIDTQQPVRIPGEKALQERRRQLADGVEIDAATLSRLQHVSEKVGVGLPLPLNDEPS